MMVHNMMIHMIHTDPPPGRPEPFAPGSPDPTRTTLLLLRYEHSRAFSRFVWSGLVFWLCSAVITASRAHDKLPYGVNSLAGIALGFVFMGAGKSIAGAMNAPVLARLKKERDNQA